MRIISKNRLVEFWESREHDSERAEIDLTRWHTIVKGSDWPNFAAIRRTFGSADQVGNCVVFDVGNNRFRLIGRLNYARGVVYILRVMDHAEYDRKRWVDECGCHRPPPKSPAAKTKTRTTGESARRGQHEDRGHENPSDRAGRCPIPTSRW